MKATGKVFSAIASTSSSLISGTGSMIGKGSSRLALADAGGNIFDKLDIDTQLDNKQLQGDVVAVLKKAEFLSCNLTIVMPLLRN